MREMKDSGIEWIGKIPTDWNIIKLKYLFVRSNAGEVIDKSYWNCGNEILYTCQKTPMYSNYLNFPDDKRTSKNDLLLTRNATPYVFLPQDGCIYSNVVQRITLQSKYDRRFIRYALLTAVDSLIALGDTIPSYNMEIWENISLPIAKQLHYIADYLDRKCSQIDAIIARQQEVIEKLKAYKLSVISEAVTKGLNPNVPMKDSGVEWIGKIPEHWEFRKIKNCCDVVDCKNRTPEMIPDGDYTVVRTTCIKDGTFSYDGSYRTDKKNFEEWTVKGRPQHGDIFFTREAPMGEACLVPDDNNLCMGQRVMFFRPIHGEDPRFILYSIYGPLAREYIESKNKGSTVGHLKLGQVASLPLLYCAPEEQKKIANYLDEKCKAINELISCKQEVVGKLQQYKKSLIYEIVTGKKEVRY